MSLRDLIEPETGVRRRLDTDLAGLDPTSRLRIARRTKCCDPKLIVSLCQPALRLCNVRKQPRILLATGGPRPFESCQRGLVLLAREMLKPLLHQPFNLAACAGLPSANAG